MQDKILADCARCARACELGLPRGDQEAVRFGVLLSPGAECFQHEPVLLPACPGAAAVPVGQPWHGAGMGCSTSRCIGRHLLLGGMVLPPWGWLPDGPCVCEVVCGAISLGFRVLGRHLWWHYLCCADAAAWSEPSTG